MNLRSQAIWFHMGSLAKYFIYKHIYLQSYLQYKLYIIRHWDVNGLFKMYKEPLVCMGREREKDIRRQRTETESGSAMIQSWLVAPQKVVHFVFKVVPIMANFVL